MNERFFKSERKKLEREQQLERERSQIGERARQESMAQKKEEERLVGKKKISDVAKWRRACEIKTTEE